MRIFRAEGRVPTPGDPKSFTGPARTRLVASDEAGVPVHVYRVEFDKRARTYWHTHSGQQWLLIVEGRIRVRNWSGETLDASAGDAVVIDAGEKHWHGAAPGGTGVHLAVNVNAKTDWLEPVTDEQYDASR